MLGSGRTGSTLLGQMLNASEDIFFAGELIDFWARGFIENRLCSCYQPARECAIWSVVVDRIKKSAGVQQIMEMADLRSESNASSRLSWLASEWVPWFRPSNDHSVRNLTTLLYESLAEVTGARLIVDSSKFSYFARLLTEIDILDLHLIHLVRDPRAVAHSWSRKKRIPDQSGELYIPRFGVISSTLRWLERNYSASKLGRISAAPYAVLSYESLIANPQSCIDGLWQKLGLADSGISLPNINEAYLPGNHAIWGNPTRFEAGSTVIALDDAWKVEQPTWQKMVVSLISAPALLKFGYPLIAGL